MVEKIVDEELFHLFRSLPYNKNIPLQVGQILNIGAVHNPFFQFYESAREYPVNTNSGVVNIKAIAFLSQVQSGKINTPDFPRIAKEVAQHFVILARELIMEEVRKEICPDAPSRKTCMWGVENISGVKNWAERLGGESKIARLRVNGSIHRADAGLLLGDSEPLSTTYDNAEKYWQGAASGKPEPEVLISGKVEVLDIKS